MCVLTEKPRFRKLLLDKIDELHSDVCILKDRREEETLYCRSTSISAQRDISELKKDVAELYNYKSDLAARFDKLEHRITVWSVAVLASAAVITWLGIDDIALRLIMQTPPTLP